MKKLHPWIHDRIPELSIFLLGVLLRLSMAVGWRYNVEWGYDATGHWLYIQSITQGVLPNPADNYAAYHPPLYHAIAAGLVKLGAGWQDITWLSFTCGTARLGLIWLGLEWYLPDRRARIVALLLAAVLPSSVLLDGVVSYETACCLFGAAAMLLWPRVFQATGRRRWQFACALGLVFGLGILTKTSIVALLIAVGCGVALDLAQSHKHWQFRLTALAPWTTMMMICLAVGGWFYVRNTVKYGTPFATTYEINPVAMRHNTGHIPYLDRRRLGFVFGWDWAIYKRPHYPSGLEPHPRFFPVVMAETFADYYNFSFSGLSPKEKGDMIVNGRPLTVRRLRLARGAVFGGTIILIATLVAWLICLRKTFRLRDWAMFSLLLSPAPATLLALAFAIKYPYDAQGAVKGIYVQFGAPPLFAMFGVAVAWACANRRRWFLAGTLLLSLAAVAAYTIGCRTGLWL